MNWTLTRELFVRMLREEWRMHAKLFGGVRFAAFPLLVAGLAVATVWGLVQTNTALGSVFAGLHVLVFLFGLHTGSVGFVGRDAVRNLLGDVTLIVFSARTLPVSKHHLLAVFLVKDAVYYSLLFLLPLVLAFGVAPGAAAQLPALWLSVTGMFLLGATVTLTLIGLSTRGVNGGAIAAAAFAAVGAGWMLGVEVTAFTPYGFFSSPSVAGFLQGFTAIPVLGVAGVASYDFSSPSPERTVDAGFRQLAARIPTPDAALVAKSLLDLSRSSGGVGKVFFSAGIIFAVSVAMIRLVRDLLSLTPSVPVAMGGMLGLTAFTSYNWLTQFDDLDEYLIYPVDAAGVFRAKFYAFLATGLPTGLLFYALAVGLFGGSLGSVVAGGVLAVGLQLYLFGLTSRLAGLSPNEFLFDTVLFAVFSAAVAVILVPVLIAGLVVGTPSPATATGLVVLGAVAAVTGVWLHRTAATRDGG